MNMDRRCHYANTRLLPKNNALYGSSTMSNELELLHLCLDVMLNGQSPHILLDGCG